MVRSIVLVDIISGIEVCLFLDDAGSWWIVLSLLCACPLPWEGGPVLESLVQGVGTSGTRRLSLDTNALFLTERDVPLCCVFLEPSLAVRTLDVIRVGGSWTLRGQGGT